MSKHPPSPVQDEVDRNYEAFIRLLPTIIGSHRDKFALMKDGEIISFFSTAEDARTAGEKFIADNLFSIQEVTDMPLNFGFYTDAIAVD